MKPFLTKLFKIAGAKLLALLSCLDVLSLILFHSTCPLSLFNVLSDLLKYYFIVSCLSLPANSSKLLEGRDLLYSLIYLNVYHCA